ncbi:hypothetical protein Y032_0280g1217 [Ancylostoma ceylanicum]|uniref:Oxidoreductase, short chain dehydrogenase/reductase family protein n=1 Tax=Ancylostoma ceylanicum TaxID=53326 RepID=A0A016S6Q6_9BILA|nr:hypothetical protein Y032_0280g1217 [Ancylostoma ceylanicum]
MAALNRDDLQAAEPDSDTHAGNETRISLCSTHYYDSPATDSAVNDFRESFRSASMLSALWTYIWWAVTSYFVVRVLKCLFILVKSVIVHFITPIYDLDHLKDSWTVVTGGTDGIGRAYIEELAKSRGIRKFYLIGRNRQKLDKVVSELRDRYDAECKTAIFDFECDGFEKLPQELKDMDVGILINCAGIAPNQVANFMELPDGTASKIFRVNLMSNVKMLELVLPGMIKRNKGCVVNFSSMTGWRPLPYISAYPASKAAISFFSDCLSDEFRHTNVRIQCLIPMLVATKVASYEVDEANNLFVVTPENYAKQAVRAIGRFEILTGCVQHDVQPADNIVIIEVTTDPNWQRFRCFKHKKFRRLITVIGLRPKKIMPETHMNSSLWERWFPSGYSNYSMCLLSCWVYTNTA